jgi:hypothetical protein
MEPLRGCADQRDLPQSQTFQGVPRRLGANGASLTFCGFDDVIAALTAESAVSKRTASSTINIVLATGHARKHGFQTTATI